MARLRQMFGHARGSRRSRNAVPTSEAKSAPVVEERNAQYDRETVEVIRKVLASASNAIDVGANVGSILAAICAQAPSGSHHAFEPLPALAAQLTQKFPTVTVHQLALAATSGTSSFHHVVTNDSYSGLRRRRYDRPDESIEIISVETARLDDVIRADLPIEFVKIDVEGGELGVLLGASRTLASWRPIVVFEHGLGAADYYGSRPEDVHAAFSDAGLAVTLMERWLRGLPDLSVDEFVDEFDSGRNYYFLAHHAGA